MDLCWSDVKYLLTIHKNEYISNAFDEYTRHKQELIMKFAFYIAILVALVACQKSEPQVGASSAAVSSLADTTVVVVDTVKGTDTSAGPTVNPVLDTVTK